MILLVASYNMHGCCGLIIYIYIYMVLTVFLCFQSLALGWKLQVSSFSANFRQFLSRENIRFFVLVIMLLKRTCSRSTGSMLKALKLPNLETASSCSGGGFLGFNLRTYIYTRTQKNNPTQGPETNGLYIRVPYEAKCVW